MKILLLLGLVLPPLLLASCAGDCGCGGKRKGAPDAHTGGPRVAGAAAIAD